MRRAAVVGLAFWLVSALFLGIGTSAANPSDDAEGGFVTRIGEERAAAGLGGYVVAADLVDVARRHAEEMRRQQRLHHNPSLGNQVQGWQAVGENVGVGPTVESIHEKLMASPSHRDNILSGTFTEVGVGVVVDGSDLWIVQVFRLPQSAATASSSGGSDAGAGAGADAPDAESSPASAPEPRPAPAPAPAPSGSAPVRAASAATATVAPPASPSSVAASPVTATTAPAEVPTTLAEAAPSTPDTLAPTHAAAAAPPIVMPAAVETLTDTDVRSADARQVTWPVAVAATMLLGVVTALAAHVAGGMVRSPAAAGRRTSLLDVWELAVAG